MLRKDLILSPRHHITSPKALDVRKYEFKSGRRLVPTLSMNSLRKKRKTSKLPQSLTSRKSIDIDAGVKVLTKRWKKLTHNWDSSENLDKLGMWERVID